MKFKRMVEITSETPRVARSRPARAPRAAAAAAPPSATRGSSRAAGASAAIRVASAVAAERAGQELALGADVPHAAAEGERDREAREEQRAGLEERRGPRCRAPERPGDEGAQRVDGREPEGGDHHPGEPERRSRGRERAQGGHAAVARGGLAQQDRAEGLAIGARRHRQQAPAHQGEHAVGEGEHLLELRRDQQDGAASRLQREELLVHEARGADVEAARRVHGHEGARGALELARHRHLLRVASGEQRDGASRIRRTMPKASTRRAAYSSAARAR